MDFNGCLSNVYDIDINHFVNVDAILFLFICWDVMSLINHVGKTKEVSQKSILKAYSNITIFLIFDGT